jgi:hypothetical protein
MAFFLGTPKDRQYDLATAAPISLQLGAANLNCVRVTNGQDKAASGRLCENASKSGLLLTALYSGTRGNQIIAGIGSGTAVNSKKLTLSLPGVSAEVFDNLQGEGEALWRAMAEAVNHGQMNIRGPSQLVRAKVTETEAPAQAAVSEVTLSGGTDGATGITDATLLGTDGTDAPRKGMYALRGTNSQVINLTDVTDKACWPVMAAFARSEGVYAIAQGPASAGCKAVSEALNSSGVDDWHLKLIVGDWPYWMEIPVGWNGTITAERMDATLDDFWAKWEENYYNGIDQPRGTITETITEANGTVSVYRYEGVSFHLTDAGNKQGEKTVNQTLSWTANRRKKVN